MEANQENKWHQNPIVVIALIIFLFPVGLYFMWKNELWSKRTRWIVTTIVALAVIANFGDDTASSSSSSNNYSGTYIGEGIDTRTEVYISSSGSFYGDVKDPQTNWTLNSFSGNLDGNRLVFEGNNADVQWTGTVSGNTITINMWTDLYGDVYVQLYKQ